VGKRSGDPERETDSRWTWEMEQEDRAPPTADAYCNYGSRFSAITKNVRTGRKGTEKGQQRFPTEKRKGEPPLDAGQPATETTTGGTNLIQGNPQHIERLQKPCNEK